MSFESEFAGGFSEALNVFGQTAKINGVTHVVIAQNLASSEGFTEGGFRSVNAVALHIQRDDNRDAPAVGNDVLFDGKKLRISNVESDEVSYYLTCYDPNAR